MTQTIYKGTAVGMSETSPNGHLLVGALNVTERLSYQRALQLLSASQTMVGLDGPTPPPRPSGHLRPDSIAGRQMYRIGKSLPDTLTDEQKAWNAAVEAKKQAKKCRKL